MTLRDSEAHEARLFSGNRETRIAQFSPAQLLMSKAPAPPDVHDPRPAQTRYPVSLEAYQSIKDAVTHGQIQVQHGQASSIVEDRSPDGEAGSGMARASLAQPGMVNIPVSFAGLSATALRPPDCTLAVGPDHVVVAANASVAIYKKDGSGPLVQMLLTRWFSGVVRGATIFDPRLAFDAQADRWVLLAAAYDTGQQQSWLLLSVSQTDDPTGGWWSYASDGSVDGEEATNHWADYPCLGIGSEAIYITVNMFTWGDSFTYPKLRVIPKSVAYSGSGMAPYHDLVGMTDEDGGPAFTIQPCQPLGNSPDTYFVSSHFPRSGEPQSKLSLWTLSDPLGAPSLSRQTVATNPYTVPPAADQLGSGQTLDSGDTRLLGALSHGGTVWTALSTAYSWPGDGNRSAILWFEIDPATASLQQQSVYGLSGAHYFYPAIMLDDSGNMFLLFGTSGPTQHGSLSITARRSGDPAGQLLPSTLLKGGVAPYGGSRWGDYAGIGRDPADGAVVWVYGEYADQTDWATWVAAARL